MLNASVVPLQTGLRNLFTDLYTRVCLLHSSFGQLEEWSTLFVSVEVNIQHALSFT